MYNNFSSKKTKKVISALLASALVVTSAPITANAATKKVVGVGKTITYNAKATVKSAKAAKKGIVKVTKKGKKVTVKGVKAGATTVTIKTSKNKTIKLNVKVGATSITKKTVATSMNVGEKKTLSVNAVNGKGDTIQFTSSKKSVVKVNKASAKASAKKVASTTVTAVAEGTAKITAKSKYTGKSKTFTIKVVAATPAPASQAPATNIPTSGGGVTGTATTAPTATAGTNATATPGTNASATPGTDATATPGTDVTQAPGTDVTPTPGTDVTPAPGTDVTPAPGTDPTATPEVPTGGAIETPAPEENVKAALKDAYKVTNTKVQVNFSNKIAAPTAENFAIEGLTISAVELTEDQKSVILTVSEMEIDKNYTVSVKGIVDVNGEAVADATTDFTARKVQYAVKLEVVNILTGESRNELKANGQDNAKVIFTLLDDAGNVVKESAEVQFTTTAGNFAENRVSVQNGVATNTFTSEISATQKNAYITATVVSADNKDLVNLTASKTISMNPSANTEQDQTVGASLTDVTVETCDRVILYFNKDVTVTDYTKNQTTGGNVYTYDPTKMSIRIKDNAGTATAIGSTDTVKTPIALAPVPDETKALYALLPEGDYLTDNSKVLVEVADKTKSLEVKDTKPAYITDTRNPSMLKVTNKGLKSIVITFSEPIQSGASTNSAEDLTKWVIDNTSLANDKYGVAGSRATATVGTFNSLTGKDERNIVTITLGQDGNGDEIYFKAGSHSVQGNNIGDWANMTDEKNNLINTQTLDFKIEADETAPTATVTVESPEQFDVKFNTTVAKADLVDNLKLQQYIDGSWVNVDGNPIAIRAITDTEGTEYIVELTKDWTKILDTATTNKNYYNYQFRLNLAKETIENKLNGLKNAEINLNLNSDIMTSPDVVSPSLEDVTADGKTYVVINMSEPVQMPDIVDSEGTTTYTRTLTPTTEQGTTLAKPIVQFISSDNSTTVTGEIKEVSEHDNSITVEPKGKLTAGTWKVVVRNVSDDVGNTATTLVKDDFVVEGEAIAADTGFQVLWAVAVQAGKNSPLTGSPASTTDEDIIYVKFNKQIKTYGGSANAGATTNYIVNGYSVPSTSKIESSVTGYNDKANLVNSYNDLVAIHLPKGTLKDKSNHINISQTLESAAGAVLGSSGGLKLLTLVDDDSRNGSQPYFAWNYSKYAYTGTTPLTVQELQTALDDGSYTEYDFTGVTTEAKLATSKVTISHAVSVDFNNKTVQEVVIDTKETGIIELKNVTAEKITVNAPNADVKINTATITKAGATPSDVGILHVVDVLAGTLTLTTVTADKLYVTDTNGGSIHVTNATDNNSASSDCAFGATEIATTGDIKLKVTGNTSPFTSNIELSKAAKLTLDATGITPVTVKFDATAKGATVVQETGTTVTASYADGMSEADKETCKVTDSKAKANADIAAAVSSIDAKFDAAGLGSSTSGSIDLSTATLNDCTMKVELGSVASGKTAILSWTESSKTVGVQSTGVDIGDTQTITVTVSKTNGTSVVLKYTVEATGSGSVQGFTVTSEDDASIAKAVTAVKAVVGTGITSTTASGSVDFSKLTDTALDGCTIAVADGSAGNIDLLSVDTTNTKKININVAPSSGAAANNNTHTFTVKVSKGVGTDVTLTFTVTATDTASDGADGYTVAFTS